MGKNILNDFISVAEPFRTYETDKDGQISNRTDKKESEHKQDTGIKGGERGEVIGLVRLSLCRLLLIFALRTL